MKLKAKDRVTVCMLAAILRIADAMDYSHVDSVQNIKCSIDAGVVNVTCRTKEDDPIILEKVEKKKDLFEEQYEWKLEVKLKSNK